MDTKGSNAGRKESWYPESGDEGEGTKETMSLTSFSGSTYHSSHYLDAVKLRVNLYDSYRLARIILGIPIKSFNSSLNSKAIFDAIKVVAEMKMELIQLQGKVKRLEAANRLNEVSEDRHRKNTLNEGLSHQNELFKKYHDQMNNLNASQSLLMDILSDSTGLAECHVENSGVAPGTKEALLPRDREDALCEAKALTEKSREIMTGLSDLFEMSQEQSSSYCTQIDNLLRQVQTKSTIQQLELESFRTKHAQQVMDLCCQLQTYKEQVASQHEEMMRMQERYHELESLAVTPSQAHDVLHAINQITEESPVEEQMDVQGKVVNILEKMSHIHTKQIHDEAELQAILEAAKRKEKRSIEELKDLKLQEEILLEETRIPAEDWRQALVAQRSLCERQISDIMSREESRLLEMEILELKLTELAFSAVEIEDLRDDIERSRDQHEQQVAKINSFAVGTESSMARLRHQLAELIQKQKESIQSCKPSNPTGQKWKALLDRKSTIDRIDELEKKLMIQNEELCSTKEELTQSKAKIQLLEHKLSTTTSGGPASH